MENRNNAKQPKYLQFGTLIICIGFASLVCIGILAKEIKSKSQN